MNRQRSNPYGRLRWLAAAGLLATLAAGPTPVLAQDVRPAVHRLVATDLCVDCHFPREASRPDPFQLAGGFCQREQAAIWQNDDKHRRSFDLLATGPGGELTEAILGFALDEVLDLGPFERRPDGIVPAARFHPNLAADDPRRQVVERCLACHAPVAEDPMGAGEQLIEYGVSCQACHGPAGDYKDLHQSPEWRLVRAEIKDQAFGLRDLRHPAKRAALCASCHVGSLGGQPATGGSSPRFIKHEWYAKGHPPLPGFELVAYSAQMPPHWQPLASKLAAPVPIAFLSGEATDAQLDAFFDRFPRSVKVERDAALARNYLAANAGSFSPEPARDMLRTKHALVGALSILASTASLVADAPEAESRDLALFDCGACHHELRSQFPSVARVQRGLPPGRPPAAEWPRLLAALAVRDQPEVAAALARLDAAYGVRPFGDLEAKRAAAARLRDVCNAVAGDLAGRPLEEANAAEILRQLTDTARYQPRGELLDFHAARQLAWAAREIAKDLAGVPLRPTSNVTAPEHATEFRTAIAQLLEMPPAGTPEQWRERIDDLFREAGRHETWGGPLRLRLPAGQSISILAELPGSLEAISSYDASSLAARLQVLHERLAASPQR